MALPRIMDPSHLRRGRGHDVYRRERAATVGRVRVGRGA
jgi:hypothetical protein